MSITMNSIQRISTITLAREYIGDSLLTGRVQAAVFNVASLKSAGISVETHNGVVHLSGFVSSDADIARAVDLAHQVKGVRNVKNDMRLK